MSLSYQVLGAAGRDNALLVRINSGQAVEQLLFDCGDGCLSTLSLAEIRATDHLFFSHFHMDHVGGFDSYFRCQFNDEQRRHQIWGPPGSSRILQHRFQGFLWNLHDQMSGSWRVTEISPDSLATTRFELREAFEFAHTEGVRPSGDTILQGAGYTVNAMTMDHRTPSIAYVVRELPRQNVDQKRMAAMGLRPGPWLKQIKDLAQLASQIEINGQSYSVDRLRSDLIVETPGDSVAYLTDFLLDESAIERLCEFLRGCRTIVCEGQYRHLDIELALKNFHMTTVQSATMARRVGAEDFVLFHLSERYTPKQWLEMLHEARQICPSAHYPDHWNLDG